MLSVVQGILPCVLSYGIGMALRGSICTEVDGMVGLITYDCSTECID